MLRKPDLGSRPKLGFGEPSTSRIGNIQTTAMNIQHLPGRARKRVQKTAERFWFHVTTPRLTSAQNLTDETFLALFDLEEVAIWLEKGDVPAAKAALLAHFGNRTSASWPTFPNQITYLGRSVNDLSEQEILDQANALVEHHFTLGGMPEVDLGKKINWRYNPTADPRWNRRLHRFEWLPVLTKAYAQTGDERYATGFVNLIVDWIVNHPPPPRKNEKHDAWILMSAGMRCVSWTLAFGVFYHSPAFSDTAKLTLLRSIYDHARFLCLFKTARNHLIRESNGLAYLGIYFPEFRAAAHWRKVALHRLEKALKTQVNPDGSHVEVSTGYQWLVIQEFEGLVDLLQANNLSLRDRQLADSLERMYRWLAYLVRPDGSFPQLNDGVLPDNQTVLATLVKAGESTGQKDLAYIGARGRRGLYPKDRSIGFQDAGLYVLRNNWTPEAHYLLFDAGPYGGPHGHEDKLSIEVCAFGQPIIVDSGSYTYENLDPLRAYFVGSEGHNTVLIDGQSQIRRWKEENLNPTAGRGNHARWISQADLDYVAATYRDGYAPFQLRPPLQARMINDVTHTRRILFMKPDYWVIVDELQALSPHNYQLLFHTHPSVVVRSAPENRISLIRPSEEIRLDLIPADPQSVKVTWASGDNGPIQSWYSTDFYQKVPSTVIIYEREGTASTAITTLLYPCRLGQTEKAISIAPLAIRQGRGLAYVVTTPRGQDHLLFAWDNSVKQFGPFESRGTIAVVRTDHRAAVLSRFEWQEDQASIS